MRCQALHPFCKKPGRALSFVTGDASMAAGLSASLSDADAFTEKNLVP